MAGQASGNAAPPVMGRRALTLGLAHGHYLRDFIRAWFSFGHHPRLPEDRVVVLVLGTPIDAGQPNPTGDCFMAHGNVGQRIPLMLRVFQRDGVTPATFDGEPVWSSDDGTVVEVRNVDGMEWAYLMGFGATNVKVTIDADRGEGVRSLRAVAQVIVNDPASEAQIVAIDLGDAEDVPV